MASYSLPALLRVASSFFLLFNIMVVANPCFGTWLDNPERNPNISTPWYHNNHLEFGNSVTGDLLTIAGSLIFLILTFI
jgi:hypothetical protein